MHVTMAGMKTLTKLNCCVNNVRWTLLNWIPLNGASTFNRCRVHLPIFKVCLSVLLFFFYFYILNCCKISFYQQRAPIFINWIRMLSSSITNQQTQITINYFIPFPFPLQYLMLLLTHTIVLWVLIYRTAAI